MDNPIVYVTCRNVRKQIDPRTVGRRLTKMLVHLGLKNAEVSCVLCDDLFIRNLNRDYRGKDKATDVLSFAMNEGEVVSGDRHLLGDIIISVETAIRQGRDLGHSPLEEVTSLAVHGLLHLLGYDHLRREDELLMQKKAFELEGIFRKMSA